MKSPLDKIQRFREDAAVASPGVAANGNTSNLGEIPNPTVGTVEPARKCYLCGGKLTKRENSPDMICLDCRAPQ